MNNPKSRVLWLLMILLEKTDYEHTMTAAELISELNQKGIPASRQNIYNDIKILCDMGFDIELIRSRSNEYYCGSILFELPELKILVDSIISSQFITEKKSKNLVDKLSKLTSIYNRDILKRNLSVTNCTKSENETVLYTIDMIEQTIKEGKKFEFQYITYDKNGSKSLKYKGKVYVVSPYECIWHDERYYLVGYSDSHQKIVTFRVDRICNSKFSDLPAQKKPNNFNTVKYYNNIFKMYDGEIIEIQLLCNHDMMDIVKDFFGNSAKISEQNAYQFKVTVDIGVSPPFYGWLFQFAGKIQIISPQKILEKYREMASLIK